MLKRFTAAVSILAVLLVFTSGHLLHDHGTCRHHQSDCGQDKVLPDRSGSIDAASTQFCTLCHLQQHGYFFTISAEVLSDTLIPVSTLLSSNADDPESVTPPPGLSRGPPGI